MVSTSDKYDRAIAILTARVNAGEGQAIFFAWDSPSSHSAGCLFEFTGRDLSYGCLTTVRSGRAIEITLADLPVFAEWQRRLDAELGRVWVDR